MTDTIIIEQSTTDYSELLAPTKPKKEPKPKPETVERIQQLAESPAQTKSVGWSNEDIETIGLGVGLILLEGTRALSRRMVGDESLAMEQVEYDVISKAASRLILRHIKVKAGKRGDVTDSIAILTAIVSYGIRVQDAYYEHKQKS